MSTPSQMLSGEVISGWHVKNQLETFQGQTGGHFSTGYIVEKDGKQAFLKAMDLHNVIGKSLKVTGDAIRQYEFERTLFEKCGLSGLSHIVRMLDQGDFVPDRFSRLPNPEFNRIYFIVFEYADGGDIRRELKLDGQKLDSWNMTVLHQIAVALSQLHSIGIAHQDLKPSNVLSFKQQKKYKLADLGRSSSLHHSAPTDEVAFPGDMNYAPPEYFYQFTPPEHQDRRIGSDAYLLGSMISFLYLGLGALSLTRCFIEPEYWFDQWSGSYEDVLPFLVDAHSKATLELSDALNGNKFKSELSQVYFQLCHPNPSLRGNPKTRASGKRVGLDRYISEFDRYAKDLAIEERIRRNKNGS